MITPSLAGSAITIWKGFAILRLFSSDLCRGHTRTKCNNNGQDPVGLMRLFGK